ncbi:hypothetical protein A2810_02785 [candidate division Kazan bacterium RIFCSPHIGHO2_01_FULL_49_10]|uniref:Uncharacterized protein n=1 Tax=candidate division Kazan bacterium RIFCSPLOWO2_01_FULL_48_13 TaxID=1798539 RepID=A0A1F4PME6_UNCK3|nr:MAG: hypothetical protein A2810_02785 [candidate division Kazan bacterium RIFCSPHIGHO2_01_FULL_49_10]OGB84861.1 MAG: hypothetical protein A2994_01600 [candidate division Kazan bacterium RIFCSPLOWO2_01_FULL_48_13]
MAIFFTVILVSPAGRIRNPYYKILESSAVQQNPQNDEKRGLEDDKVSNKQNPRHSVVVLLADAIGSMGPVKQLYSPIVRVGGGAP